MLLNINSIRECTESEGIGKRFAIWTQGCLKRCRNCCNTHMQPIIKKHIVNCDDIIEQIKYSKENYHIEGITLLGGEPILQSKGLSYIAKWCKENNLSVILFSGYTLEEINTSNFDGALELLNYTDVLIDGEYIDELYDEDRGFIGSSNQKVYFFTDVYTQKDFDDYKGYISVEFIIDKDTIKINGWPSEFE
ncbi:4Fe-4S single cluster domain-containing protein [Brachyspira hampsonii]|uniref:4Fe-4S single cluster domain-containing protein n=1 Tax=Brachyspira hampsonii TaxID=1287055 RepID=UPI000D3AFF2A|nr:4Fe-4S single cluster domain-containing protein [Brachyspira hampsonii]PTY39404.1 radical SAM protein [Brachyspira hampsonii bv. II]